MKRRDLLIQTILSAAGAAASTATLSAREFPPNVDASKELARSDWKPLLLDDHQNETLILLSDLIIPETDTPGAKAALVNRFLDHLMANEKPETQRDFLGSLAYLDGESMQRYKSAFLYLPHEQQIELLTLMAYPHSMSTWGEEANGYKGNAHFEKLKIWIASAYYSSEAGLKELGWNGEFPHGLYSGCDQTSGTHQHSAMHDSGKAKVQ